jgi:hypothetical protein
VAAKWSSSSAMSAIVGDPVRERLLIAARLLGRFSGHRPPCTEKLIGVGVADALARFLVARCDSHHAGWRVVRQVVVDSAADAPWEKCARRAVPLVSDDLVRLAGDGGRTPLARAQHIAAQRRAEQIAVHVDQATVLADLGLDCSAGTPERWRIALTSAVGARSREQVARALDRSLRA